MSRNTKLIVAAVVIGVAVLAAIPMAKHFAGPSPEQIQVMRRVAVREADYDAFHQAALRISKKTGCTLDTAYSNLATYMYHANLTDIDEAEKGTITAIQFSRAFGLD